jgi:hypothetical protein
MLSTRIFAQFKLSCQPTHIKSVQSSFVRNFADKMGLPRVFFDMAADGNAVGRIVIEVSTKKRLNSPEIVNKICRLEKCGREK